MKTHLLGITQVILGAVCWGTTGIITILLYQVGFHSHEIVALRILLAAFCLLIALPYFLPYLNKLSFKQLPILTLHSLIGMLAMSSCYFIAVTKIGVALAVVLLYTAPIWAILFACLLLKEKFSLQALLLTILASLGVSFTMLGSISLNPIGITWGLLSGICYALYTVLGKRAMCHLAPTTVFFSSIMFSALALLCMPTSYFALQKLALQPFSIWLVALSLALIGTILAYALYTKGLAKMGATKATVFTVFEPLTALLLALFLLAEQLALIQYIGIFLIILTAVLNALATKEP